MRPAWCFLRLLGTSVCGIHPGYDDPDSDLTRAWISQRLVLKLQHCGRTCLFVHNRFHVFPNGSVCSWPALPNQPIEGRRSTAGIFGKNMAPHRRDYSRREVQELVETAVRTELSLGKPAHQ